MTDAGLTLSRQQPVAADADVTLDDAPPSEVWAALADDLVEEFADAVRDVLQDAHAGARPLALADLMDDGDRMEHPTAALYASVFASLARDSDDERHHEARALFESFGQEGVAPVVATDAPLDHVGMAVVPILATSDVTPTVTVRLVDAFRDRRADHRRRVGSLLAALSTACDVRVYGSGVTLRWFAETHHADLPGSVREQCSAGRETDTPVAEAVATAREALDHDGSTVAVLRALADADSETRTYSALTSSLPIERSTVRNHLATLRDLELVSESFPSVGDTAVELRRAGREYLDTLDSEIGRQRCLSESVRGGGNPSHHARVVTDRQARGRPTGSTAAATATADRAADRGRHHTVEYLSRREHAGAVAAAPSHGVGVTDYPVDERSGRLDGGWSYNNVRDELVVSAEFVNVLPWRVTLARTLLDSRTFDHVLDADRLDDAVDDLVRDHKDVLRGMRCLGYLPNSVDTAAEFVDALQDARDDLLELTRQLRHESYELEREEFRGVICREALGLAGVAIHLLNLADVDVTIECRLPQYSRHFDTEYRDKLVETIATEATVFSSYRHHVARRHLFEDRADKRRQVFEPTIDADDPFGELIPSYSIVGRFGTKREAFADVLEDALATPAELHEDAPEFSVPVRVQTTHGRRETAHAARRILEGKRLDTTREAVSVLDGFARTPYDVADALAELAPETFERDVRIDETRFALAHLDADRLLADAPPTVRAVTKALLAADEPLSRTALADRADVSTRSVRDHLPTLLATDVVRETPEGYRLALSFHTSYERRRDVLPSLVTDDSLLVRDVVYETLLATDAPIDVFEVWTDVGTDGVPDVARLVERDGLTWLSWALPLLRGLGGEDQPDETREARFGATVEQTALQATADAGGIAG